MCELLGLSANNPTDICFSFTGLIQRGGGTGPHKDGWGIALYEGNGCRLIHDPEPSVHSEMAKFIKTYPIKSRNVICHIRKANRGRVCLENTHPFMRELWGRQWSFAHNGQMRGVKKNCEVGFYHPVGTTDSEHVFCWMLSHIRKRFSKPPKRHSTLWRYIRSLCQELDEFGTFNCLLCDSKFMYAYCSTHLSYVTRRAPFGKATLKDADVRIDFNKTNQPNDVITVIATRPLTHQEPWTIMKKGQFMVFRDGECELSYGANTSGLADHNI